MLSRRDLMDTIEILIRALDDAPHKTRMDFQPYWDWYDGPRTVAILRGAAMLKEPVEK